MGSQPGENAFLDLPAETIEGHRRFERERLRFTEQAPQFSSFPRFCGDVRLPCVAVQRRRDEENGTRSGKRKGGIEIEREPRLGAYEEPQARNEAVQVRVVADAFNATIRCIEPQRIEP